MAVPAHDERDFEFTAQFNGEWADAERVLVASLPAEGTGGSGTGAPERLAGWDSVILRRTV